MIILTGVLSWADAKPEGSKHARGGPVLVLHSTLLRTYGSIRTAGGLFAPPGVGGIAGFRPREIVWAPVGSPMCPVMPVGRSLSSTEIAGSARPPPAGRRSASNTVNAPKHGRRSVLTCSGRSGSVPKMPSRRRGGWTLTDNVNAVTAPWDEPYRQEEDGVGWQAGSS